MSAKRLLQQIYEALGSGVAPGSVEGWDDIDCLIGAIEEGAALAKRGLDMVDDGAPRDCGPTSECERAWGPAP